MWVVELDANPARSPLLNLVLCPQQVPREFVPEAREAPIHDVAVLLASPFTTSVNER